MPSACRINEMRGCTLSKIANFKPNTLHVKRNLLLLLLFSVTALCGQNIALYQQFNGRYDFTFAGNTLNTEENGAAATCTILTSSSAELTLAPEDTIERAFLYWAGSGPGDLEVKLNGQEVAAERTFPLNVVLTTDNIPRTFFAAFANVTEQVQQGGPGSYTLSDLDLTAVLAEINPDIDANNFCFNGTNFGGWTLVVIYSNNNLPLNQLNLYDGMQYVPDQITINLPSLNVIDNIGAKIGFVAWEGDRMLNIDEKLSINNITLSNSLNPATNAFNGTNSITGATNLYNMDLDVYDIEGMVNIGDQYATIKLESGRDFVMVNAVITKLNSQLPDATVAVNNILQQCNLRTIELHYTVSNINSTDVLPANTPVAIYANGIYIDYFKTINALPIDGTESGTITITIPASVPSPFELKLVADQTPGGAGTVTETNEGNNVFLSTVTLWASPPLQQPANVTGCDLGGGLGIFDFSGYLESLKNTPSDIITFYLSAQDAQNALNALSNINQFPSTQPNQVIYVRLQDANGCFTIGQFQLTAVDCDFPDATITIDNLARSCNTRLVTLNYTVGNYNSADILPAGTSISFYVDGYLAAQAQTVANIAINGSESGAITLNIPGDALDFTLTFAVDDVGDGTGTETEIDENNNTDTENFSLIVSPTLRTPEDLVSCNTGYAIGLFDFSAYGYDLKNNQSDTVTFYNSEADAQNQANPIANPAYYQTVESPQTIFVRLETAESCFTVGSFQLKVKNCPPETYNYVTPNGDGLNDTFFVKGLRNVFTNFRLSVYNRWGNLVWTGNHSMPDWDGIANETKVGPQNNSVPDGTYYFVLELNDPDYPEPITGWVYVVR